jgi:hypothetical protein
MTQPKATHPCAVCLSATSTSICAECAEACDDQNAERPAPDADPFTITQDDVERMRHAVAVAAHASKR